MSDDEKTPAPSSSNAPVPHYDPFSAFRSEIDRMFESFFGARGAPTPGLGAGFAVPTLSDRSVLAPTVDITENDKAITITAELPGMSEEDVDLEIQGGVLTLSGEKRFEQSSDKDNVHTVERRYGAIRRSFRLPDTVDVDAVAANFDKGVLKITLPKKPEAAAATRKVAIGKS